MFTDKKTILSKLVENQMFTLLPVECFDDIEEYKRCLWVRGKYKNGKYECFKYFDNDYKVYKRGNCKVFTHFVESDDINRIFPVDK